jgi:hypothetical protein
MSNTFDNMTVSDLADEIGKADSDIKARTARLDEMKGELKLRGVNMAAGHDYVVSISESTTKRLDTKRLQEDLGDALDGYYNTSTSSRVLIKPAAKLEEA